MYRKILVHRESEGSVFRVWAIAPVNNEPLVDAVSAGQADLQLHFSDVDIEAELLDLSHPPDVKRAAVIAEDAAQFQLT
jgi:hypothetical protein